jgi:hypothetical protein
VTNPQRIRHNLATDPSLETGTASPADFNCTSASSTAQAYAGTKAARITVGATTGTWYTSVVAAPQGAFFIYDKTKYYLLTGKVKQVSGAAGTVSLYTNNSANGIVQGPAVTPVTGGWTTVYMMFAPGPGTTAADLYLLSTTGLGTQVLDFDALTIEEIKASDYAAINLANFPYFDGATAPAGYTVAWDGAANASPSTATETLAVPVNHNNIYRSSAYDPEIRVATGLPVNATWTDYTPANGILYTYRAVAVASTGAEASS